MATTTTQSNSENTKNSRPTKSIRAKGKVKTRRTVKTSPEGMTAKLYREGKDAVSSAFDSASIAGVRVGKALPKLRNNLHLRARSQSLYTMMEERPLVLGAVGLGVGMVLAGLLPSVSSYRHKR